MKRSQAPITITTAAEMALPAGVRLTFPGPAIRITPPLKLGHLRGMRIMEAGQLRQAFGERFGHAEGLGVCRAPGRINLIGEHTDYNGLPVLPMTLSQDIKIAFAPRRDGTIRMHNVDPAYPEREFRNEPSIPPSAQGSWDNYCKAAVEALNARFGVNGSVGMDMLVAGTIPVAAGLSSSSALVVACALAYLAARGKRLGKDISRLDLAGLLAEGEHYVGTQGGGMDQAIILLGSGGQACKIDFFPLRVESVPLPEGHVFVGCNSLVKAEKTGEALHRYNAGPRLCRVICALVERRARAEFGEEITLERLGDLWQGHLCLTHDEGEALIEQSLPKETMTLEEMARALDKSPREIRDRWLGDLREPEGGFRVRARARHLCSEYRRVESARDALLAGDVDNFGRLMDGSHKSCAEDYEISCPELDILVSVARAAGARGARLTGAGFGGCTVNLVPELRLEEFQQEIERSYYANLGQRNGYSEHAPRVFTAHSGAGAGYVSEK